MEPNRLALLKALDTGEEALSAEWIGSNRVGCLLTAKMSMACLLDGELLVLEHSSAEFHKIGIPFGVCEYDYLCPLLLKSSKHDQLYSFLKTAHWGTIEEDSEITCICSLGVWNDKICALTINTDNENSLDLHIFSVTDGFKQNTVKLPGISNFWGLHMPSESGIFITDQEAEALYMYEIPSGKLLWKTEGLDSPADITSDSYTGNDGISPPN